MLRPSTRGDTVVRIQTPRASEGVACWPEAPIFAWHGQRLVRVSCQVYTHPQDIDRLVEALAVLLGD
jgi:selenocysteine lyase/cysteine desulfurase